MVRLTPWAKTKNIIMGTTTIEYQILSSRDLFLLAIATPPVANGQLNSFNLSERRSRALKKKNAAECGFFGSSEKTP
jgi:hypothetical protein